MLLLLLLTKLLTKLLTNLLLTRLLLVTAHLIPDFFVAPPRLRLPLPSPPCNRRRPSSPLLSRRSL
jgi:hypothetical protein